MSRSLARVEAALAAAELPVRVIEAGACRTAEEAAARGEEKAVATS